jgi:cytochrome c-type biogenesis protein CcmH
MDLMLGLALASMTGAAVLVVLIALARSRDAAPAPGGDVAVYRDQIDEIERDRARGLIGGAEAASARAEIARRLIAAADRADAEIAASSSARRRRIAAAVALVGVPLIALGVYGSLGRPELPDRPLAGRMQETPDSQNVAELVSRVEAALAKNPEDGRGWYVIAPIYMRLGRPADAAAAYANAIRLLGSTGELEANLGEALFAAQDGIVTPEARAAFERSVRADPPSVKGTLYLARAAAQDNEPEAALALLKPLLLSAPADAPYLSPLRGELERLAAAPPLMAPDGAGQEEGAPRGMEQVRAMVDRLGERLAGGGGDLGEWLRLVKSRTVLGDRDQALVALATARKQFAADPRAAARLEALALGLGLEGRGA